MTKQVFFTFSILLVHCITTLAQPTAAPTQPAKPPVQPAKAPVQPAKPPVQPAKAPAPAQSAKVPPVKKGGPPDVTKILGKAGGFSVFIRLLKSTGISDQIYGQLNNSNNGFTIFAPTDTAFSNLKPGTINSLSDLQKTQLIQFHILNTVVTISNFQTLSNPVPTEAGDTGAGEFPLSLTTAGNQVNISTGLVNTTLGETVYSDNQLDIYQVDSVLLPQDIFDPKAKAKAKAKAKGKAKAEAPAEAEAPTLSKPPKSNNTNSDDAADTPTVAAKEDNSGAVGVSLSSMLGIFGVVVVIVTN
uniref:FAS1 domain-containing protein n=1 Tax=Fagus sylvatica TaxID=28930 RepID=A0A2N9I6S9_FAGSY